MTSQNEKQQSAQQKKQQKEHKDFAFLLKLDRQPILGADLVKYTEVPGTGSRICEINEPFKIYLNWVQYNYKGYIIKQKLHTAAKKLTLHQDASLCPALRKSIETMRLEQRSWFKVTSQQLHDTEDLQYGGCLFEIYIQRFLFLRGETMEAKRKFIDQSREKGKEHFKKQEYQEAIKLYRDCINTTEGLRKKNDFSEEDICQLKVMNIKAKQNFIRCFLKLVDPQAKQQDLARKYANQIVSAQNEHLSYYLKAAVLLKVRYLSDALESAKKALEIGNSQQCLNLIKKIEKEIEMKKKKGD